MLSNKAEKLDHRFHFTQRVYNFDIGHHSRHPTLYLCAHKIGLLNENTTKEKSTSHLSINVTPSHLSINVTLPAVLFILQSHIHTPPVQK
jgi:hypothetical protein